MSHEARDKQLEKISKSLLGTSLTLSGEDTNVVVKLVDLKQALQLAYSFGATTGWAECAEKSKVLKP